MIWGIIAVVAAIVIAVVVTAAVLYKSLSASKDDADKNFSDKPVGKTTEECPLVGYELVELIEVVTQDEEKYVTGPGSAPTDKAIVSKEVKREDKDSGNFKQYINLKPDLEGAAKRHPEYGRKIQLRARVKQKNGQTDKLAGVKVIFSSVRVDGPNRADPGGTDPAVWAVVGLTAAQKEGFGGSKEKTASTDAKGWTSAVDFSVSEFAGDQFKLSAKLDPSVEGASTGSPKTLGALYVVWRKFWYQMTYADGYSPPKPTNAVTAYAEVFAEMIWTLDKKFKKADLPADLRDRTFMPEYQLKKGGANKIIANVGADSNIGEFSTNAKLKLNTNAAQPVKENVIACEYQCDPKGPSQLKTYKLTSAGQSITVPAGTGGPVISKPPIKKGAALVSFGEWSAKRAPWTKGGDITDDHIEIKSTRTSTRQVTVNLPAGVPIPTALKPIWVRLKLETCRGYLGWATAGGIVAVYRASAAAGASGSKEDFADTTAHEFGHKFNQTPKPTKQPASLKNHPKQYVGHGGSGPHCRYGATVPAGAVNWQNRNQLTPSPSGGTCIMYHSFSSKCSHKYCTTCKPYLQLQKMDSI